MKKLTMGILAFLSLGFLSAQGKDPLLEFDLPAYGLEVRLGLRPLSLIPGTDTIFWVGAGGALKFPTYLRDSATDQAIETNVQKDAAGLIQIWTGWKLGMAQGLVFNPRIEKNLLEAFVYYQGDLRKNYPGKDGPNYLLNSQRPDRDFSVLSTFIFGLEFNNQTGANQKGLRDGQRVEASVSWIPQGIQSVGVDAFRFTAWSSLLVPVFDLEPSNPDSTLSVTLGNFLEFDYITGGQIPVSALQSFGGRKIRSGLAGSVRGIESGRFDGQQKFVANFDLRINGPTLFIPKLIPGLLGFFDVGYSGQVKGIEDRWLTTTGFGLYLNLLNYGEIGLSKEFWLNGSNFEPSAFSIILGLHF